MRLGLNGMNKRNFFQLRSILDAVTTAREAVISVAFDVSVVGGLSEKIEIINHRRFPDIGEWSKLKKNLRGIT